MHPDDLKEQAEFIANLKITFKWGAIIVATAWAYFWLLSQIPTEGAQVAVFLLTLVCIICVLVAKLMTDG